MIGLSSFLVLLAVGLAHAADTDLGTVVAAFDAANIPTDANITFDPSLLLEVTFLQANGSTVGVTAGATLPRNATAEPPLFSILDADGTAIHSAKTIQGNPLNSTDFVVAMIDLDPPTPQSPIWGEIRHFLGSNFTFPPPYGGGDIAPLVNNTPAISNWLQPTPPPGSYPHRYVFLLYAQSAKFDEQTLVNSSTPVYNFDISSFAAATGLGDPLAGTFMLIGPDPTTEA